MPYALPEDLQGQTWEPSTFTQIAEGYYFGNIFEVKPMSDQKGPNGTQRNYYVITQRIQGSSYDGEDIIERFVGLDKATIFRLFDILSSIGQDFLANYYDVANKRWLALPTIEELQGKRVAFEVIDEPFHAKKDGVFLYVDDPTTGQKVPKMLSSMKIHRYFDANKPLPEYTPPTRKTPQAPAAPALGGAMPQMPSAASAAQQMPQQALPGLAQQVPGMPVAPANYPQSTPW